MLPLSHVLTPLDFPVWGYMKHKVFLPPVPESLEELWTLITEAAVTIDAEIFLGFGTNHLQMGHLLHDMGNDIEHL